VETATEATTRARTEISRIYALATLAEALLARGDAEGARDAAERSLAVVAEAGSGHVGDLLAKTVLAQSLRTLGRMDEARGAIESALALLRERALRVTNPARRKTMLERVPDHRRVLEVARELEVPLALGA
jgi:Flp pilus assembly protein TadD